ncbi:MAG: alginate O-acetyltransferase AlgX-related protein [Paracoccaceae bacterium]
MNKPHGSFALLLAALCGTAAWSEPSSYGCSGLDTASALSSIEGQNGVFYRVLADLRMRHPMENAVMEQMAALSKALAANGTTLIYVAVPTKSQAMPQYLPTLAADYAFDSDTATLVYDDIIDRLHAHGVLAPDLRSALAKSAPGALPFFQADFHWTPVGSRLAAAAISEVMKAQSFYGDLPVAEFVTTELASAAAFSTMRRTLQGMCRDELPRVESARFVTEVVSAPMAGASDIFAGSDEAVQIALVGTSFSDSPVGAFAGYLSEYSGLDVVNYAVTGGNQFGSITSYLTSRDFADNRPRFLVWENPIYSNLAQYGADPMDELIAAAGQTCTQSLPVVRSDANSLTADLSGLAIGQQDLILADLGTEGPRSALFQLATASGLVRSALMQRTDRMDASGRFFKPLGSIWHSDLTTVTVTFDRPVSDDSTLTLCLSSRKDAL